jgi:predicted N-formylglutamate amidohydrolase
VIVSCEHGGNRVPPQYRARFRGRRRLLQSHRGYDPGALTLARQFAASFGAPLHFSTVSRLVVELNRSASHPALLSLCMQPLAEAEREALLARHYLPYRAGIEKDVRAALSGGRAAVHLSCHSFTPRLNGVLRTADIGLLYDPRNAQEAILCRRWQKRLADLAPRLRVRRNYPYRGSADGLTTSLRRRFAGRRYAGIELEVSQRFTRAPPRAWRDLRAVLIDSFGDALEGKEC